MSETIVKPVINRMLLGLLGRNDLIDAWWDSQNLHFGMKTPNEVYLSGEKGRQQVFDYVSKHCNHNI